ncbi:MAG: hypothetical protein F4W99_05350 [Chloroflexi bacterium]|nr:hypothetical protein [Chloroflexota bacterium]MYD16553.1 hypothetical protein [Chloroflexota bacterium]MYJ02406.1 hypothetical protein [Chloroflexota bacterium]
MRLYPGDVELLGTLARMPFLDRLELAALSGRSRAAVYQRIDRFLDAGLAESVGQASELVTPTRRFCLSARGVRRLASEEGAPVAQLLRTRPVSEQWRRLLLERLDAAAAIYRLAEQAAQFAFPLGLHWQRAAPMDAALELAEGRRAAVVRQGRTADRTGFAKRVRRLKETPGHGAVLVICPDETRLRHARRLVAGPPAITFLALERDVALAGAEAAVWRGPTGAARLTLREALGYALPSSAERPERPLVRVSLPEPLGPECDDASWMLPAALTTAEKRALDLIGDWPWLRPGHLAALLGVGRRRLTQLLARLDEMGLITRPTRAGAPRLALSDRGLAYHARRDRTSVGIARKRWSPEPRWPDDPFDWRNVPGSRSRQLLRNLEHTESVHWFNTLLAGQAREQGSRLLQLDPPHRASRYFRSFERMRSIQPDAYALLETPAGEQALFLEWERRAVRPATMAARLAPYLRYHATGRPVEDHGLLPRVLVVFEDELAADHFLRIAADAVARAEVPLPLLVSDRLRLEHHGPLGPAWRSIEHTAQRGLD